MDFFNQIGKMALGSRLRRLSEHMTDNAAQVYKMYDIDFKPKWFPVYYVLANGQEKTVTEIAEEIGHSHPLISKIVNEMSKNGLVVQKKDRGDARKNVVHLSEKGHEITIKIQDTYKDVNNAIEEILEGTRHNLWKAMEEWEHLLQQKPYLSRVREHKKKREAKDIQIVDFQDEYREAFRSLNVAWITKYFKMEESDYIALDNPDTYILGKGGNIVVALYKGEPVGVCALIKSSNPAYDYELAKMAVDPKVQGKNIGWMLGQAIIEKARAAGASQLFLESNTRLTPAINLYYKLGFQKVVAAFTSPYERANIQMVLLLK